VSLGFKYDNILMEEAAQILEIETFIPMLLQEQDPEAPPRLKRVVLIGDHNQVRTNSPPRILLTHSPIPCSCPRSSKTWLSKSLVT